MTTSGIRPFERYDSAVAKALLAELAGLSTFADVECWDGRAQREIGLIKAYLDYLGTLETSIAVAESRAKELHTTKSFLQRALTSPAETKAADVWRKDAAAHREELSQLIDQMEAAIDKTPNSADEQREMLRELKLVKKELGIQKRETNEAMRQIRTTARQQSAKIGTEGLSLFFSTPKTRRWSRMGVRLEKESAVAPHETTRTQLERQILVVERTIRWVEKFR
jgi:hypothetical protein